MKFVEKIQLDLAFQVEILTKGIVSITLFAKTKLWHPINQDWEGFEMGH